MATYKERIRQHAKAPLDEVLLSFVRSRAVNGGRSRHGCAPGTIEMYTEKAAALTRTLGPGRDCNRLELMDLEGYILERREGGVCDHTIRKELTTLRAALRRARRERRWRGELAELFPDFSPDYTPRRRALEAPEFPRLLDAVPPARQPLVAFLCLTGARHGEWQRVEFGDVDLDQRLVKLRGTKSPASDRTVPIPAALVDPLLDQLFRAPAPTATMRLFPAWSNIRRDLHAACQRAAIAPVSPNDLRRPS